MKKIKPTYCADLVNSTGGSLDLFSADDLETLTRHLAMRLLKREWQLHDGDTIRIFSRKEHTK